MIFFQVVEDNNLDFCLSSTLFVLLTTTIPVYLQSLRTIQTFFVALKSATKEIFASISLKY